MIYVGDYEHSPAKRCEPDQTAHPRDFKRVEHDCFTNHPYFLDLYSPDEVIIVLKTGTVRLVDTQAYALFKNEMSSGELWSCVNRDKPEMANG